MHGGVLLTAGSFVADLPAATAGAIRPGEVSCLADQLSPGFSRAPQLGARLHVGARFGGGAEGQLTLTVQSVSGARQAVRERQLSLRLVQQTVSYTNKPTGSSSISLDAVFIHVDIKTLVT